MLHGGTEARSREEGNSKGKQRGIGRWIVRSVRAAGWAPLAVLGLHVAASKGLDAYKAFPALDIPIHILGGMAIAYFFARSLRIAAGTGLLGQPSRFALGLLVFTSTCAAAVFWEFAEWLSDRYLGTQAQLGLDDTLLDMLFGILGGTLFLAASGIRERAARRILPGLALLIAAGSCSTAVRADDPPAGDAILTSPFAAPRPSFFHAALEVPALAAAAPLPPGKFYLRLSSTHARSVERHRIDGRENLFDGLYHEWGAFELRWGALPRLEVSARAVLAGWDEELDRFLLFDRTGRTIVRDEDEVFLGTGASSRHDNVSKVVLGAKVLLYRDEELGLDVAAATSLKIPTSRAGDLTGAGTFDLNVTVLGSLDLDPVVLHANAGAGFPLDRNTLFEKSAGIDLDPFFHWGVGAVVKLPWDLALIAQLEGNTSAFEEVEFLDGSPLTAFGGLRKLWAPLVIEAGAGAGLVPDASYDFLWTAAIGILF